MKINCLSCGHKLDLDDVYDDYKGLVKCWVCKGLLEIKTAQGQVKSINFASISPSHPVAEEVV